MKPELDIITYINQSILNTLLLHPTYNLAEKGYISEKKQILNTKENLEEIKNLVNSIPNVLKFLKNEILLELENTEQFKISYNKSKDALSRLLLNKIIEKRTEGIPKDELTAYIEIMYSSLPYRSAVLVINVGLYFHAMTYSLAVEGELPLLKIYILTEVKNMIELDKLYFNIVEHPVEKELKTLFKAALASIYDDIFADEKTLLRNPSAKTPFLEKFAQIVFQVNLNDLLEKEVKLQYSDYLSRFLVFIKSQNFEEYNPIVYLTEFLGNNFFKKTHNSILKRKVQDGSEISFNDLKNLVNVNNIPN